MSSAPWQVMRRYHIQDRDDYKKYNKLCGMVTKLVSVLRRLDAQDPARIELTDQVLSKCAAHTLSGASFALQAHTCSVRQVSMTKPQQLLLCLPGPPA